ncbi:2-phospho-L-lactate guanylyltransferase [Microbacterium sp. SYP-A9085]|uniref:2-phospho-L-lactate guanylyltransferase n=1 Tax=Microbacterium sp. SYP-A9085 TaxID=2664454 RepID=UPI00129B046E|nr:2-phospho-L-lactate guanylyltransferase [Microbacterium sp. SYP-A9085]MRH28122.1 2-phospho-L-lactate guanylyltransferase [Microbacterium sp. SYP-A9085]
MDEFCTEWTVVVPVKHTAHGKSRLGGVDRERLAAAIALDTIAAACAVCPVVVVTADATVAGAAQELGATVVPEDGPHGLNAAIAAGIAAVPDGHRAALLGDLPALRGADLAAALREAASVDRAVVPDAEGTGSTLVTARAGVSWAAAFGDGSLARHIALGCTVLEAPEALRRDVDTSAQLAAAARLGLGPRTAALWCGAGRRA